MILHILYKIFKTDLHLLWHWQKRLDLQCYQTSLEWIVFFFPSSAIETCFWLFVIAWHNISVCQSQTKWAEGRRWSTRISGFKQRLDRISALLHHLWSQKLLSSCFLPDLSSDTDWETGDSWQTRIISVSRVETVQHKPHLLHTITLRGEIRSSIDF